MGYTCSKVFLWSYCDKFLPQWMGIGLYAMGKDSRLCPKSCGACNSGAQTPTETLTESPSYPPSWFTPSPTPSQSPSWFTPSPTPPQSPSYPPSWFTPSPTSLPTDYTSKVKFQVGAPSVPSLGITDGPIAMVTDVNGMKEILVMVLINGQIGIGGGITMGLMLSKHVAHAHLI